MTETMMIIIVAGAVVIAFGLLCLISIFRAQKETQGFSKKIGAFEKDLNDITKLVSQGPVDTQKADAILQLLEKQDEKHAAQMAEMKAFQKALEAKQFVVQTEAPKQIQAEAVKEVPKAVPKAAPKQAPKAAPPKAEPSKVEVPEDLEELLLDGEELMFDEEPMIEQDILDTLPEEVISSFAPPSQRPAAQPAPKQTVAKPAAPAPKPVAPAPKPAAPAQRPAAQPAPKPAAPVQRPAAQSAPKQTVAKPAAPTPKPVAPAPKPAAPAPKPAAPAQKPVAPAPKPTIMTPPVKAEPIDDLSFDEIDINDLLDDFEDVLPEITTASPEPVPTPTVTEIPAPVRPTPVIPKPEIPVPQRPHIDYDIGQSGRKYTASELETLIRE